MHTLHNKKGMQRKNEHCPSPRGAGSKKVSRKCWDQYGKAMQQSPQWEGQPGAVVGGLFGQQFFVLLRDLKGEETGTHGLTGLRRRLGRKREYLAALGERNVWKNREIFK